jgi:putative membrane fusion protein
VDETGNITDSLSSSLVGTDIFTDEDYNDIRSTISLYKTDYSDEAFYEVYNFKSNIDSKVLELSNELLMQQVSESSDTVKAGLENVTSPESGIITYYVDGFEAVTPDSLTEDMFNKSDYQKTTLKTGEIVNSSTTLFKLIDEEDWNIVCQIDYDQANLLLEESRVTFTINNSNYEITAPFELIQKENSYFLNISLSKYMTDYIDERYLSIEIILDKYEGLKIPNTAIVEKNVYKLPVAYIAKGGNEDEEDKVYVQRLDENGEVTVEKIDRDIYKTGDDYYLVNPDSFADTDVIVQMDTNDTISVSLLSSEKVQGVYIANKGIADFTEITVVKAGDEFTIVSDEDKLREFDNIIMDSSQVIENQIIY